MTTRVAVVTGGIGGLGTAICRELARQGRTVVAADLPDEARVAAFMAGNDGLDIRFAPLDVTDFEACGRFVREVEERHGSLDILVNNAGIAMADGDWNTSELTLATTRKVFETNVFGVIAVTNAFLPLLHRAESGRIVNVSSEVGSMSTMLREEGPLAGLQPGAYGASKAALNMLTVSYGLELANTPIKINAVTPGYTATDLNGGRGTRAVEDGARIVIEMALIGDDGPTASFTSDGRIDYLDGAGVPW